MSTVGSERAVLPHPRLASLATAEWPAWLWSADGARILWANPVGAAIFGAADSKAATSRRFAVTELPAAQVLRLAATLPSGGQERLERLRGFGGSLGRPLTCVCSRIVAGDGRRAILIVANGPAGPALNLDERVHRLVEEGATAAVFLSDGRRLHATAKAKAWLNDADRLAALGLEALAAAALQSGTAKGAATLHEGAGEVLITRLGQGAATVLLVVPQQLAAQAGQAFGAASDTDSRPVDPISSAKVASAAISASPSADAGAVIPGKAAAEIAPLQQGRHPLRFVWDMDGDGRFTVASDEFLQLIGSRAGLLGRPWGEIAAELKLDPSDQVAMAVASRETWSGITIHWPIPPSAPDRTSELDLPIELSGLPVFDRDRKFRGYRGFGVCRDLTRIVGSARPASTDAAPLAAPPSGPPATRRAEATTVASEQVANAPSGEVTPANVVPFRPAATAEPKPVPSLTPIERRAFRELAQELTSRLRGTPVAATAEALAQELAAAGHDQALSQDELRHVLSQALNRENGEQFSDEASQQSARDVIEEVGEGPDRAIDEEQCREPIGEAQPPAQPGDTAGERLDGEDTEEAHTLVAPSQLPIEPALLLDRIPLGILIYRHDGLLYANRTFLDLSGYADVAAIEAAGGLSRLFAGPADAAFADSAGAPALAILTQSGDRIPVEGRMVSVPWNASPAMALFINRQQPQAIAKSAQPAAEELGETRREGEAGHETEERIAASKAEFVARISHDIRNPLTAICGFAEAIMSERFGPIGNERYREYIKDLHAAAAHLSSIIDDLVDVSKREGGDIALTFGSVNLNELVQSCVGMMQPQANRARIIIRSALTSGLPLVKADERALRRVVLNLLSNSIKFTGPGGQIIVSTVFSDSREAIVRIRDTGVGMSEKQIVAALEPSADAVAWASSDQGGAELGLPLSKALAEANHAQFRIKSAPEAGTLVEIAFAPNRTLAA